MPGSPANGNGAAIEFRAVTFRLEGGAPLVDSVSLKVAARSTLVLLGRSGAGKTTALKLINRLLDPTMGEVLVEGRRTTEWDPIQLRRRLGYAIQDVGLFPHYSVERNVGLLPAVEGWSGTRIRARVLELLALVGLDVGIAKRLPRDLSGGQRQRVGVARALALDPPILLMDEPFGALDPITRKEIQEEFAALQLRLGKTVVLVTHDLREALRLGSRIALFDAGRLAGSYTPQEFRESPEPLVAAYRHAFFSNGDSAATGNAA